MANPRSTDVSKRNTDRPKRIPLSGEARNVMTISDQDPNYHYRWVNDMQNGFRVRRFVDAGWEFVQDPTVEVGDGERVGALSQAGSAIQLQVGAGVISYLMRLPNELYDEDQHRKLIAIKELEGGLKSGGDYGKLDIS